MSIIDVDPPRSETPLSVAIAEHRFRVVRRYVPPGRVIWFTVRPCRHFRVEVLHGYKTVVAPVVSFRF